MAKIKNKYNKSKLKVRTGAKINLFSLMAI
jgi:hypothetical protein